MTKRAPCPVCGETHMYGVTHLTGVGHGRTKHRHRIVDHDITAMALLRSIVRGYEASKRSGYNDLEPLFDALDVAVECVPLDVEAPSGAGGEGT